MSANAQIRRFGSSEIALHWVMALPFLFLLGSGGAIFCLRSLVWHPEWLPRLAQFHKVLAIAWIPALVVTIVTNGIRHHVKNTTHAFRWRGHDIDWLVAPFLRLARLPRLRPLAGRFNAGQKLNIIASFWLIPLLAVSGWFMWRHETVLLPWIVHALCFVLACPQVAGHLYMAVVKPSTRVALSGMFTGWVPRSYVEQHHPLEHPAAGFGPDADGSPTHLTPRVRVTAVAAGAMLMCALAATGYARRGEILRVGARLLMPGALTPRHRVPDLAHNSCLHCHETTAPMGQAKCLKCHPRIAARMKTRLGAHGRFTGRCTDCHGEHVGDGGIIRLVDNEFNHEQAAFPLAGRHAKIACDACHRRQRTKPRLYIGLAHETCRDCHDDPHRGRLTNDCTRCHSEAGWKGKDLRFVHDRDCTFTLSGAHAKTACKACHRPPRPTAPLATAMFHDVGRACADCHRDPHTPTLGNRCEICHTTDGWRGRRLTFAHDRDTTFPLAGAHRTVACRKCHPPATPETPLAAAPLRRTPKACATCHKDPHAGQFQRPCDACHDDAGWTRSAGLRFAHNRDSTFPLAGKHARTVCKKCHGQTPSGVIRYRGIDTACAACHKAPHAGRYGDACQHCHSAAGWKGRLLLFAHDRDTAFALTGRHRRLPCEKCHAPSTPAAPAPAPTADTRAIPRPCAACHKDVHHGQVGTACERCHTSAGWTGRHLTFTHAQAAFKLDALHRHVDCRGCHVAGRLTPLPTDCTGCHREADDDLWGRRADAAPSPDAHAGRVACTRCHDVKRPPPDRAGYADACAACHHAGYRRLYHDWHAALDRQTRALRQRLTTDGDGREQAELQRSGRIGAHNFQLHKRRLDAIRHRLDAPAADPGEKQ